MFEDVFGGVYDEAIEELSVRERMLLYMMAALGAPSYSFSADFILKRLLKFEDPTTLPAFQRWALDMDADSGFIQGAVRCFELGMIGCAKFTDEPPQLKTRESNDWLAWQLYGEIIFWMNKPGLIPADLNTKCQPLWDTLTNELTAEAVDPLMHLQHSDRKISMHGGFTSALFAQFREPIRKILEFGLCNLDKLSTVFVRGGDFVKNSHAPFVVTSLGEVGDQHSIELLDRLTESQEFGVLAIESIRRLKARKALAVTNGAQHE
jgi:diadenosine tetraphosphatase ApaH/serine/threonine PP2A family protein phosphatase